MPGSVCLFASFRCFHLNRILALQAAKAADDRYIVFFEKILYSLAHGICHTPAAGDDCSKIRCSGFSCMYSIISSMAYIIEHLCTFKKRLGGYAPPVKTNTTCFSLLYYSDLQSQL